MNERIGRIVYWLILVAVLVSPETHWSAMRLIAARNAWLEIQWLLVLRCISYSAQLLRRSSTTSTCASDVIAGRLSKRAQVWIDVLGRYCSFAMAITIMCCPGPWFLDAYRSNENL